MANTDPGAALQTAIATVLKADPGVAAAFPAGVAAVWDYVPLDLAGKVGTAAFPYLTIGDDQLIGKTTQYYDPTECHVKVEAWSRARGFLEVKRIAGAVRTALDIYLPIGAGFGVISHVFLSSMFRMEPDGLTRRAILQFRYTIGPGFRSPQAPPT